MLLRTSTRIAAASACVLGVAGRVRIERTTGRDGQLQEMPQSRAVSMQLLCARMCRTLGLELRVRGTVPASPAILISNHLSYLDPLVIGSLAPVVPIAKREVESWPFVGALGRSLGVLFVRRDDPHSGARALKTAGRLLRDGVSILNFPEGTTSIGDTVLPFRRGIFGLALRTGVPLVPISLRFSPRELAWTGDDYFLPHYLKPTSRATNRVEVVFGDPVPACSSLAAEQLAERGRDQIRALSQKTMPIGADDDVTEDAARIYP